MSTWLLLRGLTREGRHWGEFPRHLATAVPDAAICAIDLPGCGSRHREHSPASMAAIVDLCRRQVEELGLAPPYRLVALSLGAMVAVAWADRHPREIAGAVLMNTSLRPLCPWHWRLRPNSLGVLLRILASRDPWHRERLILELTSVLPSAHAGIVESWAAWRQQCPVSLTTTVSQLLAAWRYRAPDQPPSMPLLILAGARDALVDPACSRRLAKHWRAAFIEHAAAGHDLPLDAGDWVAQQVSAWYAAS